MFRGVCLWSGDGLDGAGLGFVSAGEAVVGVDLVSFDAEREMHVLQAAAEQLSLPPVIDRTGPETVGSGDASEDNAP